MTSSDLLDALKTYIEKITSDIILPVKVDRKSGDSKERAADVYRMRLPKKSDETAKIPYILIQFIKSIDTHDPGQPPESVSMIRIVVATYSEDESEGSENVLNILTRIRIAFLKDGLIAERYILKSPLEAVVYPDDTAPYFLGEMMTNWQMPIIKSEV